MFMFVLLLMNLLNVVCEFRIVCVVCATSSKTIMMLKICIELSFIYIMNVIIVIDDMLDCVNVYVCCILSLFCLSLIVVLFIVVVGVFDVVWEEEDVCVV